MQVDAKKPGTARRTIPAGKASRFVGQTHEKLGVVQEYAEHDRWRDRRDPRIPVILPEEAH